MVISKRQIRVESDRYGGYGNESAQADDFAAPSDIVSTRAYAPQADVVISDPANEEMAILRNQNAAVQQAEQAATVTPSPEKANRARVELPKRPERQRKPLDAEDLMPSIKTRAYITDADVKEEDDVAELEEEVVSPARERYSVSKRTKVAALVYLAVAVALAIAVIATGVSISQTTAAVDALTISIAQKQTALSDGEAELAAKLDENSIRQNALDLGMVPAGEPAIEVPTVEKVDYPLPDIHTNAFDEFCDWLSKIVA